VYATTRSSPSRRPNCIVTTGPEYPIANHSPASGAKLDNSAATAYALLIPAHQPPCRRDGFPPLVSN